MLETNQKNTFKDLSLWSLVFSNLVVIFLAVINSWDILTLLWVYWFQSVIIGFFTFIKIILLKDFSVLGEKIDSFFLFGKIKSIYKIGNAFFFLFHYGGFHFVYMIFLFSGFFEKSIINWSSVLFTSSIFFINHLFSFIYNKSSDFENKNIHKLINFPYARIIPMHLTIIFGGLIMSNDFISSKFVSNGLVLLLFLVLKMIADVKMHINEHRVDNNSSFETLDVKKIINENKQNERKL